MPEEFNHLDAEERLKAENDFLKMKLMLEKGAAFEMNGENRLSPAIENEFLQNVAAFEEQFDQHRTIKVFDKIGRPKHFKPVREIPDSEIDKAWYELNNYLNKYNINLAVCSPNISLRELYRFTTEELFEHETDDMDLPGWTTNFIYDEFYPDPVYDNSRLVEQDLFPDIFRKEELFYGIHYATEGFFFNDRHYEDYRVYSEKINRFKSLFEEIELTECNVADCTVNEAVCEVKGHYKAVARTGNDETVFAGHFRVKLVVGELGYWDMKEISLDNFNLG